MKDWLVYSIGFLAQLLFSSRLILQWITSEKQKKVVTPVLYWVLSLIGAIFLFVYGSLRNDFAIMLGQTLTYFIYIRNLQLQKQWKKISITFRWFLIVIPAVAIVYYLNDISKVEYLFFNETLPIWLLLLGIVSQIVFTFRFVYQWMYSEKYKKSTLPYGFWLLSLIGAILILTYGIIRKDIVLIAASAFGSFIYARNLILLREKSFS